MLKKYNNYKDSGIEWTGKIPQDWSTVVLKRVFSSRDGGSWGEDAKNNENDRICIRIADFNYPKMTIKHDIEYTVRNYSCDIINKLTLKKNDILIEKSGGGEQTPVGRTIIFNENFDAIYANFMDRLRVRDSNTPKFIQYLLVSFYQNGITYQYIKQTTGIQNLDLTNLLSKEYIALPNKNKQQAIADYLDKKCGDIDNTIETEKSIIEKLKEYKQSVITEVVTKGLDKSVELKDSGIEWIGKIPKHWEIRRLRTTLNIRNEKVEYNGEQYIGMENIESNSGQYTLSEENIIDGISNKFYKDDILFGKLRPYLAKATVVNFEGLCSSEFLVMKNYKGWNRYLLKVLLSYWFIDIVNSSTYGAKMPRASWEFIGNMIIPYPNNKEQKQIAEYLDKKCSQIDETIKKKEELIEKLTEYKKSLIYECVTGKRRV